MDKGIFLAVESGKYISITYPKVTTPVLQNGANDVAAQTGKLFWLVPVMSKFSDFFI